MLQKYDICFGTLSSDINCFMLCFMRRLKAEYKEFALFLFLGTAFYAFLFFYGIATRLYFGTIKDIATDQQMYALTGQTGYELQQLQTALLISTYVLSGINVMLACIINKAKHPVAYSLLFVIALVGVFSIMAIMFTGMSPFATFFVSCCGIMAY